MARTFIQHRFRDVLGRLHDQALLGRRPPPVIETDIESARIIAQMLAEDIGCFVDELMPAMATSAYYIMFNGVKIVGVKVPPRDLYREHFGALADIWDGMDN